MEQEIVIKDFFRKVLNQIYTKLWSKRRNWWNWDEPSLFVITNLFQHFQNVVRISGRYVNRWFPLIYLHTRCGNKINNHTQRIARNLKTLLGKHGSETFIETPQKLEFQSATWSDFKSRNTVEFVVCVVPSSTMFCFLDVLPWESIMWQAKGSMKSCQIYTSVPSAPLSWGVSKMYTSGSTENSQRMPYEIKKTCGIAKVRILLKRVILWDI